MAAFHSIIYGRFWVITEARYMGPEKAGVGGSIPSLATTL